MTNKQVKNPNRTAKYKIYRTYKWKNVILRLRKITQPHTRLTLRTQENQLWIWWKVVIKHYSRKKSIFQSIKAEQRSLEKRKESVMNHQETDLAGAESAGGQILLAFASLRLVWWEFQKKLSQSFLSILCSVPWPFFV